MQDAEGQSKIEGSKVGKGGLPPLLVLIVGY
jgi:hypothetical protein